MKGKVRYWEVGPGLDYRDGENTSRCPVEMLRYDNAFVCAKFVNLALTIKTRDWPGDVHEGRWQSFSIKSITEIKGDGIQQLPSVDPDTWFTMRHPKNDYSSYERVTLRQYIAEQGLELSNLI